jgi:hypothetical protein
MIMARAAGSAGQSGRNGHARARRDGGERLFNGIAPHRRISHALSVLDGCRRWGIWDTRVRFARCAEAARTCRYAVLFGDRDLALVEGDVPAVVLADAVERSRVRVWVAPRSVVMRGSARRDVVILGDALPGAGIRRRAITEHAGADRGGREVEVALNGDRRRQSVTSPSRGAGEFQPRQWSDS